MSESSHLLSTGTLAATGGVFGLAGGFFVFGGPIGTMVGGLVGGSLLISKRIVDRIFLASDEAANDYKAVRNAIFLCYGISVSIVMFVGFNYFTSWVCKDTGFANNFFYEINCYGASVMHSLLLVSALPTFAVATVLVVLNKIRPQN